MGNGIAQSFAQHGFSVTLIDVSAQALDKAMATISRNLDRLVTKEIIKKDKKEAALANIRTTTDMRQALQSADLIIEAVTERASVKFELFKQFDLLAPEHCILASNTSSISITRIAEHTRRSGKVIGMHFMNPVPVMKLVEVINGGLTSPDVTATIVSICEDLMKVPCVVRDAPGFVSNRILMPMINEAVHCLHEGVSGVQEIDTIMKLGMAHPMGPLQLADLIGLDVCKAILEVLQDGLGSDKYKPCPMLVELVDAGCLGIKTGEGFYRYTAGTKELEVSPRFKGL